MPGSAIIITNAWSIRCSPSWQTGAGIDIYIPTVQPVVYVKSFNAFNLPQIDYTSLAYNFFVSLVFKRDVISEMHFVHLSLVDGSWFHSLETLTRYFIASQLTRIDFHKTCQIDILFVVLLSLIFLSL